MPAPPEPPEWAAHTPSKKNPRWNPLVRHTLRVTDKAVEFAGALDAPDAAPMAAEWARYLGLLHDLGKFTERFQEYLRACHRADNREGSRPRPGSAPHKQHGALAAWNDLKPAGGANFALLLYGHHGGMATPSDTHNKSREKTNDAEIALLRACAVKADARLAAVAPNVAVLAATPHGQSAQAAEMFLRFLFSCLTDADALDAEAHKNPDASARRGAEPPSLAALRDRLRERQAGDFAQAPATPVNAVRREVYNACVRSALDFPPGVFELTVPTGGGKTRSSLAFSLEHAVKHGLRRVVYAIPYTSIVDQTAQVFQGLFGSDPGVVLEHHSAIEPKPLRAEDEAADGGDDAEQWRRLAAQNWDAPLIVTTTVQLFESLFSNRPAACRKLHRLARSVIVLDEVQTLPPHLLTPLVDGLKTLAANFGVTVVLCTATQPALQGGVSDFLLGFDPVQSIVPAPDRNRHFEALRRVRYRKRDDLAEWAQVADEMRAADSCLCIVNTRRQARALMALLDPERDEPTVFHLSTLMCGRHRRKVLDEVSQRLKAGLPTKLASTTVVECGVDLDFPRVLRAVGPLDRIVQAAGRCNREGRRPRDASEVTIFTPADGAMPGGLYETAVSLTEKLLTEMAARGEKLDLDDPDRMTRFFARFYHLLAADTDKNDVQERRGMFDYPEVARRVRLINEDTVSVLVHQYAPDEAAAILSAANAIGGMTRQLWQQAQPLCVSLPRTSVESGSVKVDVVPGGLYVWHGEYDSKTGVPLLQDMAHGPVYQPGELTV